MVWRRRIPHVIGATLIIVGAVLWLNLSKQESSPNVRASIHVSQRHANSPQDIKALCAPDDASTIPRNRLIEIASKRSHEFILTSGNQPSLRREEALQAWRYYLSQLDRKPYSADSTILPLLAAIDNEARSFIEQIEVGEIAWISGPQESYYAAGLCVIGTTAGIIACDFLPALIESRSDELPLTKQDAVLYAALRDGLAEAGNATAKVHIRLDSLTELVRARNPVSRLLAVLAARTALPPGMSHLPLSEGPQSFQLARARLAVIQPCSDESVPFVVEGVIDAVAAMPIREAADLLRKLRERQRQLGHETLTGRAEEMIAQIERRITDPVR